jgi:protein SCO1/2
MKPSSSALRLIRWSAWVLLILLAGAVGLSTVLDRSAPESPRAALQVGGPFALTDHDGRAVTEKTWAGRPHAVFFGFTHCPDICPTTLTEIGDMLAQLGPAGEGLAVLFITVDPERDTPEVLKDYLSSFDARVTGLSGTPAQVQAVVESWGVYARKVPIGDDYTMDHTASVFLFGADGAFRGTIDLHDETPGANLEKLRRLVAR